MQDCAGCEAILPALAQSERHVRKDPQDPNHVAASSSASRPTPDPKDPRAPPWTQEWAQQGNTDKQRQQDSECELSTQRGGTCRLPAAAREKPQRAMGQANIRHETLHTHQLSTERSEGKSETSSPRSVASSCSIHPNPEAEPDLEGANQMIDFLKSEVMKSKCSEGGALLVACLTGDLEAVKHFKKKAWQVGEFEFADLNHLQSAYFAIVNGSVEVFKEVIYDSNVSLFFGPEYFDSHITVDGMTPLMLALRFGHHEIYEYILKDVHSDSRQCQLRLKGPRFGMKDADGKETSGLGASLDKWMEFLPEITDPRSIPKRRPVRLAHANYGAERRHAHHSLEEIEDARVRRLRTRRFVAELLREGSMTLMNLKKHVDPCEHETEKLLGRVRENHRNAVCDDAKHYHISHPSHGKAHRLSTTPSFHGELRLKRSTVRNSVVHHEEWWANDEHNLDDAKLAKYMPILAKTFLRKLGEAKVMNMLKIMKIQEMHSGQTVFEVGEPTTKLFMLQAGAVTLTSGETLKVEPPVGGSSHKHVPVPHILDMWAACKGFHTCAARVSSSVATVLSFDEPSIKEECIFDSIKECVTDCLVNNMLQRYKPFQDALTNYELRDLSHLFQNHTYKKGQTIMTEGHASCELVVVQEGFVELKKSTGHCALFRVGKPPGHRHRSATSKRIMVLGIRNVIFDTMTALTLEARSDHVEVWKLTNKMCANTGVNLKSLMSAVFNVEVLRSSWFFRELPERDKRLRALAEKLQFRKVWDEEWIVEDCSKRRNFEMYFLVAGSASVVSHVRCKENALLKARPASSVFHAMNEKQFLDPKIPSDGVMAVSRTAEVLHFTHEDFKIVFNSVGALLQESGLGVKQGWNDINDRLEAARHPDNHPKELEDMDEDILDHGVMDVGGKLWAG